jgi:hypothetical protein
MNRVWHRRDPTLFVREKIEVEGHYPQLHVVVTGDQVLVRGTFPVIAEGVARDRYSVEIHLAKDHPRSLPVVREVGGRIPRTPERHINHDGAACVLLPDERWRVWPPGSTLLTFLQGPVHSFFLAQSLVERGDPWPFGQWGHGADGVREYYEALLHTADLQVICHYLQCLAAKEIKGHWDCPCTSGQRLRNCHMKTLIDLRGKIAPADAARSLRYLMQAIQRS